MSTTMRRHCPDCMPRGGRAFFERWGFEAPGTTDWRCVNCGHIVTVRHRPARYGSARQRYAIDKLVRMALPRYKVTSRGNWRPGTVHLYFMPRKWYDSVCFAGIGPRGGLVFERYAGKKELDRGPDAWIAAGVYL